MESLFLFLSIAGCPSPKMVNVTQYPWNDYDRQTLDGAFKRCGQIYQNSPCVKLFRKFGAKDYSVICGKAS